MRLLLLRSTIWVVACLVNLVVVSGVLLVWAQGAKNLGENFCGEPGRLPADLSGYRGPELVNPVTFRCDYGVDHPAVVVTDWAPLIGTVVAAVATLAVVGLVLQAALRLSRQASANRASSSDSNGSRRPTQSSAQNASQ